MILELVEVTIGGVPATKEQVQKHLKRGIKLPKPLARKMIEGLQKQALKNPVPSNRVFSNK